VFPGGKVEKEEELSRFKDSRQALMNAIDGLSAAELVTQPVEGIWTVKDLLGHITAWEQALLEPLSEFVFGNPFKAEEIPDHDAWNAVQAARCADRSYPEILNELANTRQKLIKAVEKLSEGQYHQVYQAPWGDQNTFIEMISGLAWHEEEHTKSILLKFPK
jgi:uncharacterized damage-inducible protein DinB